MRRFNTYQKRVVIRSGLGQSTVAGYLSGARKPKERQQVEMVVRGLLPDGTSSEIAEQVLHDGMLAAGFSAPPLPPATSLIREISARYEDGEKLNPAQVADLSSQVEDFAEIRVERVMRQFQHQTGGGRQIQKQEQKAA